MAAQAAHQVGLASLLLGLYLVTAVVDGAWAHPTGRRNGAARLLGEEVYKDAWEGADAEGRRGWSGWSGWSGSLGLRSPRGTPLGAPPQGPQAAQEQQQQQQQLMDAVGGLGKKRQQRQRRQHPSTAPTPAIFTALGSVGVLSDLSSFFSNLQENLESMENMTPEERRLVLGAGGGDSSLQLQPGRPLSAPALVTSLRNHRPSYKTRHFVETGEPAALRRSNSHDPQLLWAGLGR